VASRISDKASANEICISDAVFQNVRNREDLKVTPVGEMKFKNVSYSLNIYRIETPNGSGEPSLERSLTDNIEYSVNHACRIEILWFEINEINRNKFHTLSQIDLTARINIRLSSWLN